MREVQVMFNVMFKLKDFFKENRFDYVVSLLTMIGSNGFSVFIPYIIGQLIDAIIKDELTGSALRLFGLLFLISLIGAYILEFIWSY